MRSFAKLLFLSIMLTACPSQKGDDPSCVFPGAVPNGVDIKYTLAFGEDGVFICEHTDTGLQKVCKKMKIDPHY